MWNKKNNVDFNRVKKYWYQCIESCFQSYYEIIHLR